MKYFIILVFLFFFQSLYSNSFIAAYWYNIPKDSMLLNNRNIYLKSFLELQVCTGFADDIFVEALNERGDMLLRIPITLSEFEFAQKNRNSSNGITILFKETLYLDALPDQIVIKDSNEKVLKTFNSRYFTFSGKLSCQLTYSNLYLGLVPNNFGDPELAVRANKEGRFALILPQRKYTNLYAIADTYKLSTLENWFYNFTGDKDYEMNFEITNGEVYNLQVWKNNGGGKCLFVFFRPMGLKYTKSKLHIGSESFEEFNFDLSLSKRNIKISVDNEILKIVSVQSIYETTQDGFAIKSYLVQVEYDKGLDNRRLNVEFNDNGNCGMGGYYLNN